MARLIYVDVENVAEHGFEGIKGLSKADRVTAFIGPNPPKISFNLAYTFLNGPARVQIRKVNSNGANATDFQIGVLIGHDVEPGARMFVISKNAKDYRASLSAAKQLGAAEVGCYETIADCISGNNELAFGGSKAAKDKQKAQPTKAQPAKAQIGKAKQVKAQPAETQAAKSKSAKTQTAKSQPAKSQPAKQQVNEDILVSEALKKAGCTLTPPTVTQMRKYLASGADYQTFQKKTKLGHVSKKHYEAAAKALKTK